MRIRSTLGLVVLLGVVVTACSTADRAKQIHEVADASAQSRGTFEALSVALDDIYRVVAADGAKKGEVIRSTDGVWQPGEGATETSAGVITEAESYLFPLVAYRRLDVDPQDPQFGIAGSSVSLFVETQTGKQYTVTLGDSTPSSGGFYAYVAGDRHIYTVIPQVYYLALSVARGVKVDKPIDPQYGQALDKLNETGDPESTKNPWLDQVVELEGS
jgi:hypothetical protein